MLLIFCYDKKNGYVAKLIGVIGTIWYATCDMPRSNGNVMNTTVIMQKCILQQSLLQVCRRRCSCRSAVWRRNWFQKWHISLCVMVCDQLPWVKTEELVTDFRPGVNHPTPVNINGQHMEIVQSDKYMGTTIDDKLRCGDNTINLYKKGQQRLYFVRKLNALHRDRNILFVFHDSFVTKRCYDVRSCLLVGKSLSHKQRKTNSIPA